jgi:hypothetical protein
MWGSVNNQHRLLVLKNLSISIKSCSTSRILICGGYVNGRESLNAIVWVNTILNHITSMVILPTCEGSCMVYGPAWHRKQKHVLQYRYPPGSIKKREIPSTYTRMV